MVEAKQADSSMIYQALMSYAYVVLWITLSATGELHARRDSQAHEGCPCVMCRLTELSVTKCGSARFACANNFLCLGRSDHVQ